MDEDGRGELRVRLPAGLLRLLGEAATAAPMAEIVEDALLVAFRGRDGPRPAGAVPAAAPEETPGDGPVLPVLAVGDAAEVLARLDAVDKDVRWYVDENRAADGAGGTVPRTS